MKLSLLIWTTSVLAGPCKPSKPGNPQLTESNNLYSSLSTIPDISSTSRGNGEPEPKATTSVDLTGSTSSVSTVNGLPASSPFILLPSGGNFTASHSSSKVTEPGNTGVPVVDSTEAESITTTGTSETEEQPVSTHDTQAEPTIDTATVPGETAIPSTVITQSLGTRTESPYHETQSTSTYTADVSATTSDRDSSTDVSSPTHSQDTMLDSSALTSGEAAVTTSTGSTESLSIPLMSDATSASDGAITETSLQPSNDETTTGVTSSEIPSRDIPGSASDSYTRSDTTSPGDLASSSMDTDSATEKPSTTAESPNTESNPTTKVTGIETVTSSEEIETDSNTQSEVGSTISLDTSKTTSLVPHATSQLEESSQPETSLSVTETTAPGISEPIDSASGVSTETNVTKQSQIGEDDPTPSTSGITDDNSMPASRTSTRPESSATDSIPLSTEITKLPASTVAASITATQPSSTESYSTIVTQAPDGWAPTCVSGHPEWTTNTWITTTVEGSTSETVVPVLVDADDCDDDGSGLILFGFPLVAGTLFKLPRAPRFSLPCIPPGCSSPPHTEPAGEEDGDDGEEESSKTKKSSMTCTESSTVSNCLVECTTQTRSGDLAGTPECTTTCSMTATGCSVTGTTSTTEVSACSATATDWDSVGCGCSDEPDSDLQSRSDLAKDNGIQRRWAGPEKNLEKDVGWCPGAILGTTFHFPSYPEGGDVLKNEQSLAPQKVRSPLKDITRWYYRDMVDCRPVLRGPINSPTIKSKIPEGTMDHVYEKSFLRDYWRAITPRGNGKNIAGTTPRQPVNVISCNDLKTYGGPGMSLVKEVYAQYPGAQQFKPDIIQPLKPHDLGDFAGLDYWTNQAKARAQLANKDEFQAVMVRQNSRIYKALQNMDNDAKCKNDAAVKSGMWSFAARYKALMLERFDGNTPDISINPAIARAFQQLFTQISNDFTIARTVGPATVFPKPDAKKAMLAEYNSIAFVWGKIQQEFGSNPNNFQPPSIAIPAWEWETVKKRGDDEGDSCKVEQPTTSGTTLSTVISTSSIVTTAEVTTTSTDEPQPTTSGVGLTVCKITDDCKDFDCEEGTNAMCGSGTSILLPGLPQFCHCVKEADITESTTTAAEAPTTTEEEEAPATTTEETPEETEDPNAGVPEMKCSVHADCDDWEGVCDDGKKFCQATGSELVDGVPTFTGSKCGCA
ncbi:hypothetical protein HG530_007069 [Fusarium avenaceum]|nr:hypothetical protein HG530_007069 [Fusarium avenaceum]